jgi:folate-binding protein YgfZ
MALSEPRLASTSPDLVWFGGGDALRFLNDLISQEIANMEPGSVRRSLLLTPQGKLDHILWVLGGGDEIGLVVDEGRGEDLSAKLGRYRIRVDVEVAPSTVDRWLVVGPSGAEPGHWAGDREGLTANLSWPGVERTLVVGEKPELPVMSVEEYETMRIEAGEPLMGVDVTDSTIPQETGLVGHSISFDKGCFLGQELVARLDSRGGRVNHHLRILRFEGAAPQGGERVTRDGEQVGIITSSAGGIGLGLLRRGVDPGDVVSVGEHQAKVEAVPQD